MEKRLTNDHEDEDDNVRRPKDEAEAVEPRLQSRLGRVADDVDLRVKHSSNLSWSLRTAFVEVLRKWTDFCERGGGRTFSIRNRSGGRSSTEEVSVLAP